MSSKLITKANLATIVGIYAASVLLVLVIACLGNLKTDQTLSLAQLVIDAALVPIAVIGFSLAIREFRQSQIPHDISLRIGSSGKSHLASEIAIPTTQSLTHFIPVCAENKASTVVVWWQAEFVIPKPLFSQQPARIGEAWIAEQVGGAFSTITKDDGYHITFNSKGETALFTHAPVELGKLRLPVNSTHHYKPTYYIPYTVTSDRGGPQSGRLTIGIEHASP